MRSHRIITQTAASSVHFAGGRVVSVVCRYGNVRRIETYKRDEQFVIPSTGSATVWPYGCGR